MPINSGRTQKVSAGPWSKASGTVPYDNGSDEPAADAMGKGGPLARGRERVGPAYDGIFRVRSGELRPGRRSENSSPSEVWRRARCTMPMRASRLSIIETKTASGVAA